MEAEHFLFTLSRPMSPQELGERLWPHGWGYNTLSTNYRGQMFTVRKLDPPRHQWHLRFYGNGDITGHYEVDCIAFPLEHLDGVDLRPLTNAEIEEIRQILGGV